MPQFVELRGDRVFGDDPAVIAGIGDLAGMTVCAIGQERGHGDPLRNGGHVKPEGFRKAARIMRLAAELRMPLVTFIDTPGAHLDYDSEARGLAGALSSCLANMSVLPVPIVSVVIGEGGSGPALALGVADRILMQEHAVYSVIAPEGAAAIVHRDAARAQDIADALKITAYDCLVLGVVDAIVPEPENGAHMDRGLRGAAAARRDRQLADGSAQARPSAAGRRALPQVPAHGRVPAPGRTGGRSAR